MASRETLDRLLAALSELLGTSGLALDDEGYCSLGVLESPDDVAVAEVELTLDPESGALTLVATLPVAEATPALMRVLLEANTLYDGPGSDLMGMDVRPPCVCLTRWIAEPESAEALAAELDHFAGSAASWWDLVTGGAADGQGDDEPPRLITPSMRP